MILSNCLPRGKAPLARGSSREYWFASETDLEKPLRSHNVVIDSYSKAPVDKPTLLAVMHEKFGLNYEVVQRDAIVNATGIKSHYYSLNSRAGEFGYSPKFTSLEGLMLETRFIRTQHKLSQIACALDCRFSPQQDGTDD